MITRDISYFPKEIIVENAAQIPLSELARLEWDRVISLFIRPIRGYLPDPVPAFDLHERPGSAKSCRLQR